MTEPTSTIACTAGSACVGSLAFPFLAAVGLDLSGLIAGLIGCVIVQTVLPSASSTASAWSMRGALSIALVTLGSMLFASVASPLVAPSVVHAASTALPGATEASVRAATAVALGGFAQPILLALRAGVVWWARKFDARFAPTKIDDKESP